MQNDCSDDFGELDESVSKRGESPLDFMQADLTDSFEPSATLNSTPLNDVHDQDALDSLADSLGSLHHSTSADQSALHDNLNTTAQRGKSPPSPPKSRGGSPEFGSASVYSSAEGIVSRDAENEEDDLDAFGDSLSLASDQQHPEDDVASHFVEIRGIPLSVSRERVFSAVQLFGRIHAFYMKDVPDGYASVRFASRASMNALLNANLWRPFGPNVSPILQLMDPKNEAKLLANGKSTQSFSSSSRLSNRSERSAQSGHSALTTGPAVGGYAPVCELKVVGYPSECSPNDIVRNLGSFGEVKNIHVCRDRSTLIEFLNWEDLQAFKQTVLGGWNPFERNKRLWVELSETAKESLQIHVSRVPNNASALDVESAFKGFGQIDHGASGILLIPRGPYSFAIIRYLSPDGVRYALEYARTHEIYVCNRPVVTSAYDVRRRSKPPQPPPPVNDESKMLYVGKIPMHVKEGLIANTFRKFGSIGPSGVELRTGAGHKYAFITFDSADSVRQALDYRRLHNGVLIADQYLVQPNRYLSSYSKIGSFTGDPYSTNSTGRSSGSGNYAAPKVNLPRVFEASKTKLSAVNGLGHQGSYNNNNVTSYNRLSSGSANQNAPFSANQNQRISSHQQPASDVWDDFNCNSSSTNTSSASRKATSSGFASQNWRVSSNQNAPFSANENQRISSNQQPARDIRDDFNGNSGSTNTSSASHTPTATGLANQNSSFSVNPRPAFSSISKTTNSQADSVSLSPAENHSSDLGGFSRRPVTPNSANVAPQQQRAAGGSEADGAANPWAATIAKESKVVKAEIKGAGAKFEIGANPITSPRSSACIQPNCVQIRNIASISSPTVLSNYLQNRRSGGGKLKSPPDIEAGWNVAAAEFSSEAAFKGIIDKLKHSLENHPLYISKLSPISTRHLLVSKLPRGIQIDRLVDFLEARSKGEIERAASRLSPCGTRGLFSFSADLNLASLRQKMAERPLQLDNGNSHVIDTEMVAHSDAVLIKSLPEDCKHPDTLLYAIEEADVFAAAKEAGIDCTVRHVMLDREKRVALIVFEDYRAVPLFVKKDFLMETVRNGKAETSFHECVAYFDCVDAFDFESVSVVNNWELN